MKYHLIKCLFDITDKFYWFVFRPFASSVLVARYTFCSRACRAGKGLSNLQHRDGIPVAATATVDSESPRFLTKRTECISISGDIPGRRRREDSPRRLPLARRASVPNYRVGFMNTIAATPHGS